MHKVKINTVSTISRVLILLRNCTRTVVADPKHDSD